MGDRRVAIITGAGTGVGAAVAEWFAQRGFDLLLNFRSSAADAEAVAARCRDVGVTAFAEQGDVATDMDCRRLAERAYEMLGPIEVLINSAGTTLFRPMADLDALAAEDFSDIYAVNVIGPYQMARAVLPYMTGSHGSIVNVSSVAGVNGTGSSYAYAASKGALNTLTLALARNLAPRIRVNAVLPGMIQGRWLREGIGDEAYERIRDEFARAAALGIVAMPEQIADTIGWLATAADLVTGQLVTIDAGLGLGRPPRIE